MKNFVKMTERDRKILMAAASILVLAVMILGVIHPVHVAVKSTKRQIENYEKQTEVMKEKAGNMEEMRDSVQEKRERLNRLQSGLLPMMPSQKLGQLLTEKALDAGLLMMDLQITMPDSAADIPVFGAEDDREYDLEGREHDLEDREYDPEERGGIYAVGAELSVCGTMTAMDSFLDELSEGTGGVRVTALDWEPDAGIMEDRGEAGNTYMEDRGETENTYQVMRMELEIYMYRESAGQE